jgi:biopolymer transport protein ExbB/TolQ
MLEVSLLETEHIKCPHQRNAVKVVNEMLKVRMIRHNCMLVQSIRSGNWDEAARIFQVISRGKYQGETEAKTEIRRLIGMPMVENFYLSFNLYVGDNIFDAEMLAPAKKDGAWSVKLPPVKTAWLIGCSALALSMVVASVTIWAMLTFGIPDVKALNKKIDALTTLNVDAEKSRGDNFKQFLLQKGEENEQKLAEKVAALDTLFGGCANSVNELDSKVIAAKEEQAKLEAKNTVLQNETKNLEKRVETTNTRITAQEEKVSALWTQVGNLTALLLPLKENVDSLVRDVSYALQKLGLACVIVILALFCAYYLVQNHISKTEPLTKNGSDLKDIRRRLTALEDKISEKEGRMPLGQLVGSDSAFSRVVLGFICVAVGLVGFPHLIGYVLVKFPKQVVFSVWSNIWS